MSNESTPEITGRINVTRDVREDQIIYKYTWSGGDVVGITLEFLMDAPPDVRVDFGYLCVGTFLLEIIGVQYPTTLVCREMKGEANNGDTNSSG